MRCEGHVARMRDMRKVYQILIAKSEGRRLFGRPKRRREDNIRMPLK